MEIIEEIISVLAFMSPFSLAGLIHYYAGLKVKLDKIAQPHSVDQSNLLLRFGVFFAALSDKPKQSSSVEAAKLYYRYKTIGLWIKYLFFTAIITNLIRVMLLNLG